MPETQVFNTVFGIVPGPGVKGHDALAAAEKKHQTQLDALLKRLDAQDKKLKALQAPLKRHGKGHEEAASKVERLIRQQTLINKVVKQTGSTVATASRVVRTYGKDLGKAEKEAAALAGRLDRVTKETRELTAAQKRAERQARKLGQAQSGVARPSFASTLKAGGVAMLGTAAAAVTLAAALRGVASSVKVFQSLEDQLLGTQAVLQASGKGTAEEIAQLSAQARELGATTRFTATQVAETQQLLSRAGFDVQETLGTVPELLSLASAGQLDLAEATGITATILRAFDKDISEAGRVMDTLAIASSSAKTDISQLSEGMKFSSSAAASLGVPVEALAAALAVIQERGLQAGLAGRGLRTVFKSLAVETDKSAAALAEMDLKFEDVDLSSNSLVDVVTLLAEKNLTFAQAVQIAGTEGAAALLNLTRGAEKFADITEDSLTRAEGTVSRMSETLESGLGGSFRRIISATEAGQIAFTEGFSPALAEATDFLLDFITRNEDAATSLGEIAGGALESLVKMAEGLQAVADAATLLDNAGLPELLGEIADALGFINANSPVPLIRRFFENVGPDVEGFADATKKMEESWAGVNKVIASGDVSRLEAELERVKEDLFVAEIGFVGFRNRLRESGDESGELTSRMVALGAETKALAQQEKALNVALGDSKRASEKLTKAKRDEFIAKEKAARAAKEQAKVEKEVTALIASLVTEEEKLAKQLERSRELFLSGAIAAEQWARAEEKFASEETRQRVEKLADSLDRLNLAQLQATIEDRAVGFRATGAAVPSVAATLADEIVLDGDDFNESFEDNVAAISDIQERDVKERERLNIQMIQDLGGLFGQLSQTFATIGGGAGGLAELAGLGSQVAGGISQIKSATSTIGAATSVIGLFTTAFNFFADRVAKKKAKQFGAEVAFGITETGRLSSRSLISRGSTGAAIDEEAGRKIIASIRSVSEQFRLAIGNILTELPELAIKIRNDGEAFEVAIAGRILGTFSTMEDALVAGMRESLGSATFEGLGEVVSTALGRIGNFRGGGLEGFLELLPLLREIDDVNAGLSASYSAVLGAERSFRTSLDIEAEKLALLGVTLDDVIALREREIAAQREAIQAAGAGLAGVSSNLGQLQAFLDATAAFNQAQDEEVDRLARLTEEGERVERQLQNLEAGLGSAGTFAGALSDTVGGAFDQMGEDGEVMAGRFGGFGGDLIALGDAAAGAGADIGRAADDLNSGAAEIVTGAGGAGAALREAAEEAIRISEAFRDLVRDSVAAQAELGLLKEVESFAKAFGINLLKDENLRQRIQELEFRTAQIRIILLVRELELNAASLALTEAQLNAFRELRDEVAGLDFGDIRIRPGGGGGRATGRRDAAAAFREEAERVERALAGVTAATISWGDTVRATRENADEGRIGVDEFNRALSNLAALDLGRLQASAQEGLRSLRQTDLSNAMDALRESFGAQLEEALARAAANPEAYEEARKTIEAGLAASLRELGKDVLDNFGNRARAIRQAGKEAVKEIAFLVDNLEELGLTAQQVATNVRGGILPGLLDVAIAQAQRVGDAERLAELQEEKAQIEETAIRIQLAVWESMLIAAGAMTDKVRELFAETRAWLDQADAPVPLTVEVTPEGGAGGQRPFVVRPGGAGQSAAGFNPARVPQQDAGTGAGALGRTLADIIAELAANARSPLEALQFQFSELFAEIADAAGTAAERLQAQALAEAELARRRQEIQEEMFGGVTDFLDELDRTARADLAPRGALIASREAFRTATGAVDPSDQASIDEALQAAMEYRELLLNYNRLIGGGERSALVRSVEDQIRQLLGSVVPPPLPPPGTLPPLPPGGGPPPPLPPTGPTPPPPAGPSGDLRQVIGLLGTIDQKLAGIRNQDTSHYGRAETAFDNFAAHASGGTGF